MRRRFSSAADFRKSLEAKLYAKAREIGHELERVRRKVAFERLLARLYASEEYLWILKGGYALELRFQKARATKDIDLMVGNFDSLVGKPDKGSRLIEALREAASTNLDDYFEFRIGEAKRSLAGPLHGGGSFPVQSVVDGRRFVTFQLDVGLGDITCEPLELFRAAGWLAEYGFPPINYRLANAEQQFAEKFHAYTTPSQDRANTRVKDLVDMILLIRHNCLKLSGLRRTIDQVFRRRETHEVPSQLSSPPSNWPPRFAVLANQCDLSLTCEEAFAELRGFLEESKIFELKGQSYHI